MNLLNINSFLKLGYYLDYSSSRYSFDFSNIDKSKYKDLPEEELVNIGSTKLINSIQNNFNLNCEHVVPISGGLDSRALLAGLLEFTEAKRIKTYTFGTKNTLDYDIGEKVAKNLGTDHKQFNLETYKFTMNELVEVSKRVDHQTVLFHHPPIYELDNYYGDHIFWSGFMGDPIAGSHLSKVQFCSIQKEKEIFIRDNTFVKNIDLTNCDSTKFYDLIELTDYPADKLTIKEQIDFENRQLKYVAPHVLMGKYKFQLPFLDSQWFEFMLSIDNCHRFDQSLYKKILLKTFPRPFSIETKNNLGYPLNIELSKSKIFTIRAKNKLKRIINNRIGIFTDPFINYIDFNSFIRDDSNLNKIIFDNIMDLKNRKILTWIDIEKIWYDHINKNYRNANALLVLASMEIHLKAKE